MIFPALCAVAVRTNVAVQGSVRCAADITRAVEGLDFIGVFIVGIVAYFISVLLGVLEIFAELFDVPFELPQQKQAPSLIQGDHFFSGF